MKCRTTFAMAVMFVASSAYAQWQPTGQTTGPIYYSGGTVGIGAPSPNYLLHLQKITGAEMQFTDGATGSTAGDGLRIGINSSQQPYIWNQENTAFYIGTSNAERLRVDPLGNVGIGTTTPNRLMHLQKSTGPEIQLTDAVTGPASGDGTRIGMDSSQHTFIWNQENAAFYVGTNNIERIRIDATGQVGIGMAPDPSAKLSVNGAIYATSVIGAIYQDLAEWVPVATDLTPGTIVVIDRDTPNAVLAASVAYDTAVAGVVSRQPGIILGERAESKEMIATTGRVKVQVTASNGAIRIGDLLVTSNKRGKAMRSEPVAVGGANMHRPGTILGKALESLDSGEGEILVLLSMQ